MLFIVSDSHSPHIQISIWIEIDVWNKQQWKEKMIPSKDIRQIYT